MSKLIIYLFIIAINVYSPSEFDAERRRQLREDTTVMNLNEDELQDAATPARIDSDLVNDAVMEAIDEAKENEMVDNVRDDDDNEEKPAEKRTSKKSKRANKRNNGPRPTSNDLEVDVENLQDKDLEETHNTELREIKKKDLVRNIFF